MSISKEVGANPVSTLPVPETHCPFCRHKLTDELFSLVKHKVKYRVNGKSIYLSYYDCPECGNRKVVQVDDDYTYKLLKSVENKIRLFMSIKQKGGSINKQEQVKFDKMRKDLASTRSKLTKSCNGANLCDGQTGKCFIVSI